MAVDIPLGAETSSHVEAIDGINYRPLNVDSSGSLNVNVKTAPQPAAPIALSGDHAVVTMAGTRVQLPNHACLSVLIKALYANAGNIYVGGSDVSSSKGTELAPGDWVELAVSNTNLVYIDSAKNGDGVSWLLVD